MEKNSFDIPAFGTAPKWCADFLSRRPAEGSGSFLFNSPKAEASLRRISFIDGEAVPGSAVEVRINDRRNIRTKTDRNGFWSVYNPYTLPEGEIWVCAAAYKTRSAFPYGNICARFNILRGISAPVVEMPSNFEILTTPVPAVTGRAVPLNTVRIKISGIIRADVTADCEGRFYAIFPVMFADGDYILTATQIAPDGYESAETKIYFTVSAGKDEKTRK